MVWDRHVSCIVMMCRLVENGSVACPRYVPTRQTQVAKIGAPTSHGIVHNKSRVLHFGRFRVRLLHEHSTQPFTLTKLRLYNRNVGSRVIAHISYHIWPDTSKLTVTAQDLIPFVYFVRAVHKRHQGPLVVHCSSGADRAACLVATDLLMQQCELRGIADVLGTVCRIRQDRGCTFSSPVRQTFGFTFTLFLKSGMWFACFLADLYLI